MGQGVKFTDEELQLRRFRKTAFYQGPFFKKMEDVIIDKQYRVSKASEYLGENWSRAVMFLSSKQKEHLDELAKKYARNGGRPLRRIATSAPRVI